MQRFLVLLPPMMAAIICSRIFPINMDVFNSLKEGQKISFEVTQGAKGKQAANIRAA
jgi:hypothetical protein